MRRTISGLTLHIAFLVFLLNVLPQCSQQLPDTEETFQTSDRVYVANEASNTVTVVDVDTFKVLAEIDTLGHATHDLSLARNGAQLWATNLASGRISVINTNSMETIASIYTGKRAHVVTLTNDNKRAWVANIGDDSISIIDTKNFRIIGTIPTPTGPMGLTFTHDGRYAYVSTQDRTVSVVDTAAHQVIKKIPVKSNPHFLVVGPSGRIWGTNTGDKDIYVIDPTTNEIGHMIEVGPGPQQIAFGFKGTAGPFAYVTVSGLNQVAIVETKSSEPKVLGYIDVGQGPNGIWGNSTGTRLYVGHTGSNNLMMIGTGTNQVMATVPVGGKPIRVIASQ